MLSDEENEAIEFLEKLKNLNIVFCSYAFNNGKVFLSKEEKEQINKILNLIEKQSREIEEYKKQIDLDNECEIALNSKIMDLEKEIEELKEKNSTLKNLQNDTNRLYIEMIERKNYFERELQKLEDKIKAKIKEVSNGTYDAKIVLQSLLEKE